MNYNYVLAVQIMAGEAEDISDKLLDDWYQHIKDDDNDSKILIEETKNKLIKLRDDIDKLINSIT